MHNVPPTIINQIIEIKDKTKNLTVYNLEKEAVLLNSFPMIRRV